LSGTQFSSNVEEKAIYLRNVGINAPK